MTIVFAEAVQSYGGAQIATIDLASRLRDAGHDIIMVDCYGCCAPFVQAVEVSDLPLQVLQSSQEPFVIRKYSSRLRNIVRLMRYIPHWFGLRSKMRQTLGELKPNVVICYNHKVLSLISKSTNYKTIYYAHGWYLPQQIDRLMRCLLTTKVDRIIAISQATRMALYAAGIASLEKIAVVHNAIETSELPTDVAQIPNAEGCFKVLVSGGFLRDKGLHIAVEVARVLKERGFPIKLIITGIIYKGEASHSYHKHIVDLIAKYGLNDQVELVCNKPNVIPYFRACHCLIHPSATEGLPLVVLEAMALGKPVVVNAVGGVTDMVLDGYTGIIAPQDDVAFYADAIERLASDVEYRDYLVCNATSMIENTYNKKIQVKQFVDAISRK